MDSSEKTRLVQAAYHQTFPGLVAAHNKKKVRILLRSITFIASRGVQDFNLSSIAKELKMSRSNVQYYFDDVEELLEGVVKLSIATGQQITVQYVSEATDPRAAILAISRAAFQWGREYRPQLTCMLMFYFYTGFNPRMLALSNLIRDAGLVRLKEVVRAASADRLTETAALALALKVQSVITGFLLSALIHPSAGSITEYEMRSSECVDSLLSKEGLPSVSV